MNVQTYRVKSYKRTVWDYKTANIDALNNVQNAAPWYIPYTLFNDLDDIVNFNNSIIIATCKENIHCKNVAIRTKDRPWMCNEYFYGKETASLYVIKELYRRKTNSTFI